MKVIYPSLTIAAQADFEDPEYPAANVLDEHPKRKWMAIGNTAKLRITAGAGANTVAVFGSNAVTITAHTYTGIDGAWCAENAWASGAQWFDGDIQSVPVEYRLSPTGAGSMWAEYPQFDIPHIVSLEMTAADGAVVYAGVVRTGPRISYEGPETDLKEGLVDYSILRELNNGAFYSRQRDIVRTFAFSAVMDRESEFYSLLHTVIRGVGPMPLAWALVGDTVTEWDFVVYARVLAMPRGVYKSLSAVYVDIELIEVI